MTVSAHVQFIPLKEDAPMQAVDKAILIIQESGISYEVGPFGTSIEGNAVDVMKLIQTLLESDISQEFLLNAQYHGIVRSIETLGKYHFLTKFV